jgi:hypothetical protein
VAHPDTLVVGSDYFLVHYFDEKLHVPCIMTLRYEGPENADDGERLWLFRQVDGAAASSDSEDSDSEPPRIGLPDSQLYEVLDFDELLAVLNELRSVRPSLKRVRTVLRPAEVLQKHPLRARIDEFLNSPAQRALDITVRFRDKAIFLKRMAEMVELHVFTHPLRAAREDNLLAAIMRDRNIPAKTDYLADEGRTRVLDYVLPAASDFVAEICAAILAEAYALSDDDELIIK